MNKKSIHKLLIPLLFAVSINGCATDSTAMNEYENKLQWVIDANPQKDAKAALEKRDFRFMAIARRSTVIPGVDVSKSLQYELRCGVKFMEGVTDVVRSDEHLKLMKKAHSYALQYNSIIKTRCNL